MKKIPKRQCIGCREMMEKKDLIRIVRSPEGEISLDRGGRKPGRGAYLCHGADCFKKAKKSRALERIFETAVEPSVYDALERELGESNE